MEAQVVEDHGMIQRYNRVEQGHRGMQAVQEI
jgi:hypothetical protein